MELLALTPGVTLLADAGYQGLSAQTAGAVITPRPHRRKDQLPLFPAVAAAHEAERRAHSAQRIRAEHGIGHLNNGAPCLATSADASISTRFSRGRRTGLQSGTSPTTRSAPPPAESAPGRRRRVIELALNGSTTARG